MRLRTPLLAGTAGVLLAVAVPAGLAAAGPDDNPCGMSLICRIVPIAPDLEGGVDLTKQLPPVDPAAPPPDSLPPADICAGGCI